MAFSSTKSQEQLLGGVKVQVYELDFDSVTEGKVVTGLDTVYYASANNEVTETDGRTLRNKSDASTAEAGSVFVDGFTSNDTATLVVIGR